MRKLFYVILIAVVMVFGLTFVYKNQQAVSIDYYGATWGFSWNGPLALLIVATFIVGVLVGYLFIALSNLRLRGRLMSSTRKLKKIESH